jgi:hypothetical protein
MTKSTQLVLNMIVLLLIFLLIWAVMGMELFGSFYRDVDRSVLNAPRASYATFFDAIITMFQLLTRQNWPSVMYDSMLHGPMLGALFHVSWVLYGGFILLSMLVSIVLDNYERDFNIVQVKQKQQRGAKVHPTRSSPRPSVSMDEKDGADPAQASSEAVRSSGEVHFSELEVREIVRALAPEATEVQLSGLMEMFKSLVNSPGLMALDSTPRDAVPPGNSDGNALNQRSLCSLKQLQEMLKLEGKDQVYTRLTTEDLTDFALAVKTWGLCTPRVREGETPSILVHEVEAALVLAISERKARGRPMSRASAFVHIDPIIERLDADADGHVTFVELVKSIHCEEPSASSLLNTLGKQQMEVLRQYFNKCDSDRSGCISKEELGELMMSIGHKMSTWELLQLFSELDSDKSGQVGPALADGVAVLLRCHAAIDVGCMLCAVLKVNFHEFARGLAKRMTMPEEEEALEPKHDVTRKDPSTRRGSRVAVKRRYWTPFGYSESLSLGTLRCSGYPGYPGTMVGPRTDGVAFPGVHHVHDGTTLTARDLPLR